MTRSATVFGPVLAVATLLSTGCFRYVPTALDVTPQGEDIRLLVTRQGASELAQVTDVNTEVPLLQGTLLERQSETLMLRVPVAQRQEGFHTVSLDQTIRVPVGEILQVERRELDVGKTGLLVGGAIAGSAFIILHIMDAFGDSPSPGDPPNPEESRIPVPFLSVPIGH